MYSTERRIEPKTTVDLNALIKNALKTNGNPARNTEDVLAALVPLQSLTERVYGLDLGLDNSKRVIACMAEAYLLGEKNGKDGRTQELAQIINLDTRIRDVLLRNGKTILDSGEVMAAIEPLIGKISAISGLGPDNPGEIVAYVTEAYLWGENKGKSSEYRQRFLED
jgi:hypothetical protein